MLSRLAVAGDRIALTAGQAVVGLALLASVLVPLGWWRPWLAWPAAVVITVVVWRWAPPVRQNPVEPAGDGDSGGVVTNSERPRACWGIARLVLAAGFASGNALLHSGQVVIRRDPGAYALYTQWIATRHGLPIPAELAAFGGPSALDVPGFTLASPAFYQVLQGAGTGRTAEIVPQFLVGAPALFSLGWWAGAPLGSSWTAMHLVPAVLGGFALLAFGALADRLVGPRWALLATATLGLCYPIVWVARSTYSEPAALLVLLTGAVLLIDALRPGSARWTAWWAGAVVGLAGLIRVDALREVALLVAVCALLAVRRHVGATALAGGALAGTAVSVVVWLVMARPYLRTVQGSLLPLAAGTALVVGLAIPALLWNRHHPPPRSPHPAGRWPRLVGAAVLLLGAVLASRPLWLVVRQDPEDPGARFVATLQAGQGLRVDGGRTYAEHTLDWVAWYLGWPAIVIAWVTLAVLAARAVAWWLAPGEDRAPSWLVITSVGFGSMVLVLYRPGITPDHPWADRRLVPVVLPLLVLAATAGIARATRTLPQYVPRLPGGPTRVLVALTGAGLLLGYTLYGTWPVLRLQTERGEADYVASVCAALGPRDVVAAVEGTDDGRAQRAANEWVQVIRGVCGRPSGALLAPAAQLPDAVARLAGLVDAAGGRLVLLAAQEDAAEAQRVLDVAAGSEPAGASPSRFSPGRLVTMEDRKLLTRRPPNGARLVLEVWLARLGR